MMNVKKKGLCIHQSCHVMSCTFGHKVRRFSENESVDSLATSKSLSASASTREPLPCSSSVQQLRAWLAWWMIVCCRFISLVRSYREAKDGNKSRQNNSPPPPNIWRQFNIFFFSPNLQLLFDAEHAGAAEVLCSVRKLFFQDHVLSARFLVFLHSS